MQSSAYSTNPPLPDRPVPVEGESRLRVRYCECDPMGVAHHSAFIPWFEIGRTELLRAGGVAYAAIEKAGVFLVVTRLEVRYHRPARYDDLLVVVTRVSGGGRARVDHEYEVWADRDDGRGKSELLATGGSTLACVGADGRPRALPDWLRAERHAPAPG
ncbi:MAG TPA: thioesterase [Phycisphaerales bacterium]|nr:thioesterase [Phycisphaerales bacterium]